MNGGKKKKMDMILDVFQNRSLFLTFIIADVHHLLFRDKYFSIVYVSHIIEHLSNPVKALKNGRGFKHCGSLYSSAFDLDQTKDYF
jgi:ubiquinone/menaquinone biosynthesis C-methylase UbiE